MENPFRQLNDLCWLAFQLEQNPDFSLKESRLPLIRDYLPFLFAQPGDPVFYPGISGDKDGSSFVFVKWLVDSVKEGKVTVKDEGGKIRGNITFSGQAIFEDGYGPRIFFSSAVDSKHPFINAHNLRRLDEFKA